MPGFLSTDMTVTDYRRLLEKQRCWLDGSQTHPSSGPQRQCLVCRTKWNFSGRLRNHMLLLEYCQGRKSGTSATRIGCSRNTAQARFRKFDRQVRTLVNRLIQDGEIALVTEEESLQILKRLKNAKGGRRTPAENTARYLFFHGLDLMERVKQLSAPHLLEIVQIWRAMNRLKFPRPASCG